MASIKDITLNYYAVVDAGDAAATAALFAPDATYDRPGYDTLTGNTIYEFYAGDRIIETGAHSVAQVIVEGSNAAVCGTFNGILKNGSEAREGFADFFTFNSDGLIQARRTFFFRQAV